MLKPLLIAISLGTLSACVSVLPELETPRGLYQIDPALPQHDLPTAIVIREFEAPSVMAGEAMVSEGDDGALRLVRSVEWSGRVTRQMQIALIDSFSNSAEGAALLPDLGAASAYRASGRIRSLVLRAGEAHCEASLVVMDLTTRSLAHQIDVVVTEPVNSGHATDRALALKRAAEGCVSEFAAELSVRLVPPSEPGPEPGSELADDASEDQAED